MKLSVVQGDITRLPADAIVNAANESLLGGGGVDGAIHRAGGPEILAECREIRARQGGCPTGEAVVTTGGQLPARHVIHTVGPVWAGGASGEAELLAACYHNSLDRAEELGARQVAFPNISTGVYGYPKDRAAAIAVSTVKAYPARQVEEVVFVCFDAENFRLYQDLLAAD
ncbi:O-acetyl-ADP-ribose deacetylase (regulator of RNase III) [Lewinella marina]|uniref:O-acetyl-ADP-ribose deacetylase n=1 Tax=Neolewinella marina TaxID=438751 RepID=A0A2G0CFQ3_9BACT|nr:O-acetyl-ADP-ribose deacetylase [Neolewinella marina]NJB85505.1 O-acetyl-ADP-ribose deacetylase (regulator of RNase III) [Neolewinella marina]PHK98806.1 O-acetyl-ADP-ribose deacetylase [Neolewinella marina]